MDYYKPDFTPREMFMKGIYGGSYFRPIHSGVLNKNIGVDSSKYKFLSTVPAELLSSTIYDKTKNFYKVKASQTLLFWEEKGWIHPQDPRGWIEWYCKYHNGRRSEDDKRQINRALKVLVRFGQRTPTPRINQTLLHWGWDPEKNHKEYINLIKINKWSSK